MKVLSLLRREPMSKLIRALADNDGMSNSSISAASGLSYSEVNRYLKELVAKGVVMKESLSERKSLYWISPDFVALIPGDRPGD
jgi:DNA-binding IclR family transcriptional regulator